VCENRQRQTVIFSTALLVMAPVPHPPCLAVAAIVPVMAPVAAHAAVADGHPEAHAVAIVMAPAIVVIVDMVLADDDSSWAEAANGAAAAMAGTVAKSSFFMASPLMFRTIGS
jgi:hypothetical protein